VAGRHVVIDPASILAHPHGCLGLVSCACPFHILFIAKQSTRHFDPTSILAHPHGCSGLVSCACRFYNLFIFFESPGTLLGTFQLRIKNPRVHSEDTEISPFLWEKFPDWNDCQFRSWGVSCVNSVLKRVPHRQPYFYAQFCSLGWSANPFLFILIFDRRGNYIWSYFLYLVFYFTVCHRILCIYFV
jgi:hypothetical protein